MSMSLPSSRLIAASRGHSLLEVLIALSLLGIGLLAQAGAISMVTRLVDQGREAGRATFLAVSTLNHQRLQAPSSPAFCAGPMSAGPISSGSITLTWSSAPIGFGFHTSVQTVYWKGRRRVVDTVRTSIPC